MARITKVLIGMAIIVGLLTIARPIIPIIQVVEAQNVNCEGSFTPSMNCLINGIWLFANGYTTSGGVLYNTSTTVLTNGQILALNNTPIQVVPVPPIGYISLVTYGMASFNYTAVYGAGSDMKLFYTSRIAGNAASGVITNAGLMDTAASNNEVFTGTIAGVEPGKTGRAIVIEQTTPTLFTSGNAANTLTIFVQYILSPVGALK